MRNWCESWRTMGVWGGVACHELYLHVQALKLARWSGKARNWNPIGAVMLNSERMCIVKAYMEKVIHPTAG